MSNIKNNRIKVALVHDYLKECGGAERVLLALHEIFPEAPIYTIFSTIRKERLGKSGIWGKLGEARIIESWFGKLPFCDKLISPLRFLLPLVWKSFDFSEYDLIVSSASWAITKGFRDGRKDKKNKGDQKDKKLIEVCYCHTPPRYLYGYDTSRDWKKHWYIRVYAAIVNHFMRMYDFQQAQKVTYFIANSKEVQSRIKKFYRRESVVINPPVEVPRRADGQEGLEEPGGQGKYFLTGGRLEAAKNFDLIIKACNKLGVSLKVYGSGSQEKYLRSISGVTIEFLGRISDEEKFKLMAGCKAFIAMAQDEDFGITPVEAMAAGSPVIAFRGGGYLETVIESPPSSRSAGLRRGEGKTGVFVRECSVEGVIRGIREMGEMGPASPCGERGEGKIRPEDCRKQAEKFSKERFKIEIINFIKTINARTT